MLCWLHVVSAIILSTSQVATTILRYILATLIGEWSGKRGANTAQSWIAGPTAALLITMAFPVSIAVRCCGLHIVWAYHGSHNCAHHVHTHDERYYDE